MAPEAQEAASNHAGHAEWHVVRGEKVKIEPEKVMRRVIFGLFIAFAIVYGPATAQEGQRQQTGEVLLPALSYTVRKSGPSTGAHPQRNDTIVVDYQVRLLGGTLIDASRFRGRPDSFQLNRLIPAWQILIPLMHSGDVWTFYVPSEFGYGATARESIPANSFLIFEVELISFMPVSPATG